jgi:hypothetical protein
MKKIKIIKARPLKEEEEVIDQQPQDVVPEQPTITFESNPLEFILQKYPTLNKTLIDLLTEDFRDYITGVYIMAPKPTIFKIVLHNNRYFHLMFMGDNKYEAKVSGKKYQFQLTYDIFNFTNMLNRVWGRTYFLGNDQFGLVRYASATNSVIPTYSFNPVTNNTPWGISSSTAPSYSARWVSQLGLRFKF